MGEERFLTKSRCKGFKNLLLGRGTTIPVSSTVIDESTDAGKALQKVVDLNNLAYSELILLMDIKQPGGKVAFGVIKGSKSIDYDDGNRTIAWTHLVNKYTPKTAPSMV
jgi:hypothetical protein